MAIDATVGGSAANSYLTIQDADDILLASRDHSDDWENATDQEKERCLRWATVMLDSFFVFVGTPAELNTQALAWPRSGVFTRDGKVVLATEIPSAVKRAVAEWAFSLRLRDRTSDPKLLSLGFRRASLQGMSVTVDATSVEEFMPEVVKALLVDYGRLVPNASRGGGGVVRTRRG